MQVLESLEVYALLSPCAEQETPLLLFEVSISDHPMCLLMVLLLFPSKISPQKKFGYSPSQVHLIGHSVGAHLAGEAGSRIPGLGRITGKYAGGCSWAWVRFAQICFHTNTRLHLGH